mgnify:CR=1 FL=1
MTLAFVLVMAVSSQLHSDARERTFVDPVRIVGQTGRDQPAVRGAETLLERKFGQTPERGWGVEGRSYGCVLTNDGSRAGSVLLDFGRELHGSLRITCGRGATDQKLRIRFGESVSEAMSELGERGACNDHAIRDGVIELPFMGQREIGNTGFRFVRIDLVTTGRAQLEFVRAVSLMRPWKMAGGFKSSDARLNKVFDTAARTAHLCCQDYLWDGIKRDRLVWMGDTHPETMSILAVFGKASVLPESLDYMAATTSTSQWMDTMPTYTLWWLRNVYEWYLWTGDRSWLEKHVGYIAATVDHVLGAVKEDGAWNCVTYNRNGTPKTIVNAPVVEFKTEGGKMYMRFTSLGKFSSSPDDIAATIDYNKIGPYSIRVANYILG